MYLQPRSHLGLEMELKMDPWPRVTLDKLELRLKSGIIYLFKHTCNGNLELESKANQLCYDKITDNFEYDTMP